MAPETSEQAAVREITPQEAFDELKSSDAILVDTKAGGHRANWFGDFRRSRTSRRTSPAGDPLLPLRRPLKAAEQMMAMGYEDVASVAGGILEWQEVGLPVIESNSLTPEQRDRYSRHTLLPEVGVDGQVKLLEAKVLLLGAGGLGAPTALYLAAAGIGTIGLVDDDVVDASNLQRQVIHKTSTVGKSKTSSAREAIENLNPDVEVVEYNFRLNAENILDVIRDYDIIVDGADNFRRATC
jgi:hypothetical protein